MTEQNKPREWTIFEGHTGIPRLVGPAIAYAENVKVTEHSAYQSLKQENEKLREALKFYADKRNWEHWHNSDVGSFKEWNTFRPEVYNGGKRARQVLAETNCVCGEINARNCPEHQGDK